MFNLFKKKNEDKRIKVFVNRNNTSGEIHDPGAKVSIIYFYSVSELCKYLESKECSDPSNIKNRKGILKLFGIGLGVFNRGEDIAGEFIVKDTGERLGGKLKIKFIEKMTGNMSIFQAVNFSGNWYDESCIEWEN